MSRGQSILDLEDNLARSIDDEKFPGWNFGKINETFRISEEIFKCLTPEAVNELISNTNENDLNTIFDTVLQETYGVLYGKHITDGEKLTSETFGYLDKLTNSVEETLRCENLTYFISSVLPEFELNVHHLEWCEIYMMYKRAAIIAARDHGKCESGETNLLMYDGTIKKAKEVKIGDLLMGPDSTSRKVLAIRNGVDEMYQVDQYRGDSYKVNSRHTFSLFKKIFEWDRLKKRGIWVDSQIVDIDLKDYLKLSSNQRKENYHGFKVAIDFNNKVNLKIDPYYLGIWLGDGGKTGTTITKPDKEIHQFVIKYALKLGMSIRFNKNIENNQKGITIVKRERRNPNQKNKLLNLLREYNLINNKHIPEDYLVASREERLQLLAGIVDTDGNKWGGCYYVSQKSKLLIDQIKRLADGLGFCTRLTESNKFVKYLGRRYKSYGVTISGDLYKIPCKIKRKQYQYFNKQNHVEVPSIDRYKITSRSPLKVTPIGKGEYVSITTDGDHRYLHADGTVTHNSFMFSNAIPIWNCYKYKGKKGETPADKNPRGFIFSFSIVQAMDLLEILQNTIEESDPLRERLYDKNRFGKTDMRCLNKARITVKGFGSSVRGAHPGWIIIDDPLKDNVLFSKSQREKSTSYLHAVIMNMIVPGGGVHIIGTPMHSADLYGDLKTKSGWKVFEYPAIFPDGRLLWPNRWNFDGLMQKRDDQGNLIFSREILCRPISADSTIFPPHVLNTAFFGMDDFVLVQNRESYKKKFDKVVTGCDFAISGSVGADFSVFGTFGIDELDRMWLLHLYRAKGASYAAQLAMLKRINADFRPDLIAMEDNQFQQIFAQESERAGLPVVGITTTTKKNDLREGLPGLAILFERGKFKIPTGDQRSKDIADEIVLEFSSVAFTDDKGLQATSGNDDLCFMFYKAVEGARALTTGGLAFNFDFA